MSARSLQANPIAAFAEQQVVVTRATARVKLAVASPVVAGVDWLFCMTIRNRGNWAKPRGSLAMAQTKYHNSGLSVLHPFPACTLREWQRIGGSPRGQCQELQSM